VNDREPSVLERCGLASGLLAQQQIDAARATVRPPHGRPPAGAAVTDQELADRLVEMEVLNPWQAKQLLDGRTKFTLGPYLMIDSLGQGGMGHVFKARHLETGQVAAVKVLPLARSSPEAIAGFQREIEAIERLHHPRLVAALDAGMDGNVHYLVTEYVPGKDLRRLVREGGPLETAAAASIVAQVAEGLEYAHGQGFVHRDVKPGNVLVSPDGQAKLSDLGLAGPVEGADEDDPRRGRIVGTADYLSPDQVRDPRSPSPAWDIYSLGCTLYYAVTGMVPFPGGTTADKVRAHCEVRPVNPRRLNYRLSPEFVEVMADMMAKEPDQRIPSASQVRLRLAPFLEAQAVPLGPPAGRVIASTPLTIAAPPIVRSGPLRATGVQPADERRQQGRGTGSMGVLSVTEHGQDGRGTVVQPVKTGGGPFHRVWSLAMLALTPVAVVVAVLLVRFLLLRLR
jgi:serine/threonine protein kinase